MYFNARPLRSVLSLILFCSLPVITSLAQDAVRPPRLNKPLQRELLRMETEDQKYREMIEAEMIKMSSSGTAEASKHYIAIVKQQDEIDLRNSARLDRIIKQYGWPGRSLVGKDGATAAFLILQHSNLSYQQKYLPLLKEASKKGEARAADAAMLEDRVLVREGKKQIYGTQLHSGPETGGKLVLSPIEDDEHVDERRASVGMMPLAEYLKHFGMEYKPPAKKQ